MGIHVTKVAKNLSNKYGQKLLESEKIFTTDAIKNASKRAVPKNSRNKCWFDWL